MRVVEGLVRDRVHSAHNITYLHAMPLITDLTLARRLERCEGRANAAFVETRARLEPESGAVMRGIGDALAMFDGVGSPITQTFGLGLDAPPDPVTLDELEAFFESRGADVNHETSPLADASLPAVLQSRGYRAVEYTSVLVASPADLRVHTPGAAITARPIKPDEVARWSATSGSGWGETAELAAFIESFGRIGAQAPNSVPFIAEIDGEAAGAAMMSVNDGVALLAGASTVPAYRRRGVQAGLLAARIAHARASGCELVMMGAAPGSTSQCNAERRGLRMAYTRVKWRRAIARSSA